MAAINPGIYIGRIVNMALDKLPDGQMVIQAMVRLDGHGDHKGTLWLDHRTSESFPVSNFARSMKVLAHASGHAEAAIPTLCATLSQNPQALGPFPLPGEVSVTMETNPRDARYVNVKSIRIPAELKVNASVSTQEAFSFFGATSASDMPPSDADDAPAWVKGEDDPPPVKPVKPPPRRVQG